MNRIARTAAAGLLGLGLLALSTGVSPLAAQELAAGTWTGVISPPDAGDMPVTFEVTTEDVLAIEMMVTGLGTLPLEEPAMADGVITFFFVIDGTVTVDCRLESGEDGSYAGDCIGDDGGVGHLTMVPPQRGQGAI